MDRISTQAPRSGDHHRERSVSTGAGETHYLDPLPAAAQRFGCSEDEVARLRRSLERRAIVEQAKGILMARFSINAAQALDLLTRVARARGQRLRALAELLVFDASGQGQTSGSAVA